MKWVGALALLVSIGVCVAVWAGMAAAESEEAGLELQNYFSNAHTTGGQGFINITAPYEGNATATSPVAQEGEICAMIYVLDTDQALQACCGCPITADGLLTLSIAGNLAPNPLATGQLLHDGSIRILAAKTNAVPIKHVVTPPFEGCDTVTGVCCDPTGNGGSEALSLTPELVAWANHVQSTQITEENFQSTERVTGGDDIEYDPASLPESCADTVRLGSGQGFCTCASVSG